MARQKREPWEEVVEQVFADADAQDLLLMAKTYFTYYVACRSTGFNNEQAMDMVIALQTTNMEIAQATNQREKGLPDG
jgi:hypothetical protein